MTISLGREAHLGGPDVYTTYSDSVYALDARSGATMWKSQTGGGSGSPVVANDVVYGALCQNMCRSPCLEGSNQLGDVLVAQPVLPAAPAWVLKGRILSWRRTIIRWSLSVKMPYAGDLVVRRTVSDDSHHADAGAVGRSLVRSGSASQAHARALLL